MTIEWAPKRTELLIKLWKSGIPTSEIGRKLKVTKNAVVGKAHRLGLPKRQSPIPGKEEKAAKTAAPRLKPQVQPKAALKAIKPPVRPKTDPESPSRPAAVVRLENLGAGMCAWPVGEPGTPDFHFCGKRPTVPDKPYCVEHCMRAYVKSSKDRKDPAPAST